MVRPNVSSGELKMAKPTDDIEIAVARIREAAEPTGAQYASYARKLEFRAGPENYTFHACEEHKSILDTGDVMNFFAVDRQPTFAIDPTDEIECDFCREG